MQLTESQERAYSKFKELKVGALFMQQGTGKTRVAVELANTTDASLVVFIVPNSLKDSTVSEIEKWRLEKPYFIETYEGVASSDKRYTRLMDLLKSEDKVMAIADESIKFKNIHAKTTYRMMKLREYTEYRLVLNGTPITRDEWDLYSQMNWLSPKILNMSEDEFKWTFFKQIKYKRKGERERVFYEFSEVNANYLQELIAPYIFQVDLNFDKHESEIEEMISYSQKAYLEYNELKDELLDNIAEEVEELNVTWVDVDIRFKEIKARMYFGDEYTTVTDQKQLAELFWTTTELNADERNFFSGTFELFDENSPLKTPPSSRFPVIAEDNIKYLI